MAITASVQPKSARIVYARSDLPHPFQFRFSRESMDHIVQNCPRSDLDGPVRVWPNTTGLEASWRAGIFRPVSGRMQPAHYRFPTRFHSSADVPDNIVQNQPGSDLVLAGCVGFWPDGFGPEASRCPKIIRPASGHCF